MCVWHKIVSYKGSGGGLLLCLFRVLVSADPPQKSLNNALHNLHAGHFFIAC